MSRIWEKYLYTSPTVLAPAISETRMARADSTFVERLDTCERYAYLLNDYDAEFIRKLRISFNTREDAIDMGCSPWEPTTQQSNHLITVYEKCK